MIYPAEQLVNRSWYLSGIVSRDQETVSGDQITEGLYLLNALLDFQATDKTLIPYYKRENFTMVVGQETYYIAGLVDVETITFSLDEVRYPLTKMDRVKYWGNGRVNNIVSFPTQYYTEPVLGGMDVYIYFFPNQAYVGEISGKFALTDVTLATDLLTVYDPFYIEYMRYQLAQYMCAEWDISFSAEKTKKLQRYTKVLQNFAPKDLVIQKTNFLNNKTGLNWGVINLSRGFYPG